MATCEDCLHIEVCAYIKHDLPICSDFADRSKYVVREKGEWIPVTERLPEDGEVVLVYCNKGICTAEFRLYGESKHFHIVGYKNCAVTNWMPLPEPPIEEQNRAREGENDG